jgi:hypothetical protein
MPRPYQTARRATLAGRRRPGAPKRQRNQGLFPILRAGTAAPAPGLKRADNDRQKLTSLPLCERRRGDRLLARTRNP